MRLSRRARPETQREAPGLPTARAARLDAPSPTLESRAQHAAETRFRNLLRLSSDWYWEQDEHLRFTASLEGIPDKLAMQPSGYVGKARWELDCYGASEREWADHKALLDAHKPFRHFEFLRPRADGEMRWVSVSGDPTFDAQGRFTGYCGVGTDITELKQARQAQAVQHAVAKALSDARPLSETMRDIMRTTCEVMGWDYGARWEHHEREQSFRCAEIWCRLELEESGFVAISRSERFTPGEQGLVRKVLSSGQPVWISEIASEPGMVRGAAATAAGLTSAFACPILGARRTLGVLEFFARRIWPPDRALGDSAFALGRQIGQFIERKEAQERYRKLVDLSPDAILLLSDGKVVFANSTAVALLAPGLPHALTGCALEELFHGDSLARASAIIDRLEDGDTADARAELVCLQRGGLPIDVEMTASYFVHEGRPALQIILRDIRERKRASQKILRLTHLYAALSRTNQAITRLTDAQALYDEVCRIAVEHGGLCAAAIGMIDPETQWVRFVAVAGEQQAYIRESRVSIDPDLPEGRALTSAALRSGQAVVCNDFMADPRTLPWRARMLAAGLRALVAIPLRRHGEIVGALVLCANEAGYFNSELVALLQEMAANLSFALEALELEAQRSQAVERLAHLAQYDALTGLPNRSLFRDRLLQAMARARRSGAMVGVMFFDLDRFKQINDTLGHVAGDRVLQSVALRLRDHLRQVDTISRLGGDEFTVVIENVLDIAELASVAEKIHAALAPPLQIESRELFVTTSIGVATFPDDAQNVDDLVKSADIAMYHAKQQGRNTYLFYAPEMAANTADRLFLEAGLRQALERNELAVHYQPTAEVATGRVVGVEALVRWNSARGPISPVEFIPIAEETGQIVEIGRWVLRTACAQVKAWERQGLPPLQLNVNLSARQFRQKSVLRVIQDALAEAGLAPQRLGLEITETILLQQADDVTKALLALDDLGVRVAIDDFGTGYSNLAYLKRFPVDDIKIDRSFVHDVTTDGDSEAIVRAIVAMAKSLGIRVVAEGVETPAQLDLLRTLGCDVYQGYLFSRPLPAEDLAALLRRELSRSEAENAVKI